MHGLTPPARKYVGRFRGEPGLESCIVTIGGKFGVAPSDVAATLSSFEADLQKKITNLDAVIKPGQVADTEEQLAVVIDLCAWAHSEWVRIHPFANGNGRTARIWANYIAMRYGLPSFVRLRPRPDGEYAEACSAAMDGNWEPMAQLFRRMLAEFVRRS